MARIADILVEEGHNVTFFQTVFDPDTAPDYGTSAQNVIVHHPTGFDPNFLYLFDYKNSQMFRRTENLLWPDNIHRLLKVSLDQCRGLIGDPITSKLKKEKFDLVIFELIDLCPGLWLQYLNVEKIIATSSYGTAPIMEAVSGINANPSYVPYIFSKATDEMTYFERFENLLFAIVQRIFLDYNSRELLKTSDINPKNDLIDPLLFLSKKLSAYFINANEFSETARPVLRNMVFVGGLMVQDKQKPLSGEYAQIYDSCPSGVVVFSFGSMVRTKNLPNLIKLDLIKAFKAFPNLCFIWKVDQDDFKDELLKNATIEAGNIFVRFWIPQQQLFSDKRTRLFITHAGANSINEVFAFGIPVITIPLYLDNNHNSASAIRRGLGVNLNKLNLNTESMKTAISEVLGNSSSVNLYKQKAEKMAKQLKTHRRKIRKEILEWSNKVLEFGPLDQMILASINLNFFQLYCLDIIVPGATVLLGSTYCVYCFLKLLFTKLFEKFSKSKLKLS